MNYQVITDKEALLSFIDWLPELKENEIYYLCLFARNKYCKDVKHISSDKAQLRRFTAHKKEMFDLIKQLEIELGCYYQVRHNVKTPVPQEALALYITVNPRNIKEGCYEAAKHLITCVQKNNRNFKPESEVLSSIHKTLSRKIYFDVDFDISKEEMNNTIKEIKTYVNEDCITILETRGGFHCLIKLDKIDKQYEKTWYKNITSMKGVDLGKVNPRKLKRILNYKSKFKHTPKLQDNSIKCLQNLLPVVGTYQGGFTPKFINL